MDDGYEFFADRKLVTIFSAPNYCGEFDNEGAMLTVDEDLCCSFVKLCPDDKQPKHWKNPQPWSNQQWNGGKKGKGRGKGKWNR